MPSSNKKHRKHDKRPHDTNDSLSDIIPMSNDDSIKSNNELDDYNESDAGSDDDSTTDDEYNDSDDYSDDENDKRKKYDRKGQRHHEHEDEEDFAPPTIKPKRSKPVRKSKVSVDGITEVQRSKGVQQLSNKLNNNLHQIQIALPYGQTAPQVGPTPGNEGYALTDQPKKRVPFWKKRWFGLTMKVIIGICVFICVGIFLYKYLKMVEELNKRHNIFDEDEGDQSKQEIKGDKNTDVLVDQPPDEQNTTLSGGNENPDDEEGEYTMPDHVYNSFGKTNTTSTRRPLINKNNKSSRLLPKRDARGRFIKRNA